MADTSHTEMLGAFATFSFVVLQYMTKQLEEGNIYWSMWFESIWWDGVTPVTKAAGYILPSIIRQRFMMMFSPFALFHPMKWCCSCLELVFPLELKLSGNIFTVNPRGVFPL